MAMIFLIYCIIYLLILASVLCLLCVYYHRVVCFCLPYKSKIKHLTDLENSTYNPVSLECMSSCRWVFFCNKSSKIDEIVYLYDGDNIDSKAVSLYDGDNIDSKAVSSDSILRDRYILTTTHPNCSICLAQFSDDAELIVLSCQHVYHKNCIRQWIVGKCISNCPLCLHVIHSETIIIDDRRIGRRIFLQDTADCVSQLLD